MPLALDRGKGVKGKFQEPSDKIVQDVEGGKADSIPSPALVIDDLNMSEGARNSKQGDKSKLGDTPGKWKLWGPGPHRVKREPGTATVANVATDLAGNSETN